MSVRETCFAAPLSFALLLVGCSAQLSSPVISGLPSSAVVSPSALGSISNSLLFFVGYNSNGYQKLFSSQYGVTTQVSDIKPGASDDIWAIYGISGSHTYKAGIVTDNPYVLHLTDGLMTRTIDGVAGTTTVFPFTISGLTQSTDGGFVIYNTPTDIKRVSTDTGQVDTLLAGGTATVSTFGNTLFTHGNYVYSESSLAGVGKLYAYNLVTNNFSEVTGRSGTDQVNLGSEGSATMSTIFVSAYSGAYLINGATAVSALGTGEMYASGIMLNPPPNFILYTVAKAGKRDLKRVLDSGTTTLFSGFDSAGSIMLRGKARTDIVFGGVPSCYEIDSNSMVLLGNAYCNTYP